jgi:hypothetical protein
MNKTYTFTCPVCHKHYRTDAGPGEPCCTGPSEMRHDHELTVMHLVRVDQREVHPAIGATRAAGPLILP